MSLDIKSREADRLTQRTTTVIALLLARRRSRAWRKRFGAPRASRLPVGIGPTTRAAGAMR